MSVAGFNFQYLNNVSLYWNNQPLNQASKYGVSVVRAQTTGACWRCIGVFHLPPEDNKGRHNAFVEVLDEQGKRTNDPTIAWSWWIDAPTQIRKLDKPANEPAADIPIERSMTVTLRINGGGIPSDSVGGIHTRHPDERTSDGRPLNSYGHHSFYVIFQRQNAVDPEPQRPTEPATVEQRLTALEVEVKSLRAIVSKWSGD
jgi:hypothetical protein